MTYQRANDVTGWAVFVAALVSYLLTMAPTASFWDCGEFIATANELEVPHPPGAPLFLMIGRLFAMFAPDVTHVAFMVNLVSVVCSALMAMFICWTTTMLARRVLAHNVEPDPSTRATILFCGIVAGMTCTYLDTVWFNAVEAEVYSASSMFTTLVFWVMLKWDVRADQPGHLRWIVLAAFIIGLSVGVHLLPLLTIPALVLVYYFRKYDYSRGGLLLALGVAVVILGLIQFGVVQKTWDIAWGFERFFAGTENLDGTNKSGINLPFGTGTLMFAVLLFGTLGFGIWWSHRRGRVLLNTALICTVMVYLGFSSYLTIAIRSNANPPIDQNHPGNLINFLSYLKREQYGNAPLLYGQMYNSPVIGYKNGDPNYMKLSDHDRYVFDGYKQEYEFAPGTLRFFPRMHSRDHYASGPFGYQYYVTDKGADPRNPDDDRPSMRDNLKFFFEYQVYHMYIRYFLWNFVGRASDVQHAEFESGFNFRELRDMPADMRNHPARNHYYYLPLLLGILGLAWHVQFDGKRAAVVGMLFLFTGLAIVLYLNQVAQEPRERDYAFVGSYHTFAIWVGLGVAGLAEITRRWLKQATPFVVGTLALLAVPGLLAAENWDDHDRHNHYVPPDSAYNLLNSCDRNAILFTNGDNDTFPLWYLQEVEGIRTDVRVVNLSLLNTDWYIHQLKHVKWNDSEPLPISLTEGFYMGDKNGIVPWRPQTLSMPVDRAALLQSGAVAPELAGRIESPWRISISGRGGESQRYLQKQDVLILNMLSENARQGWKRPIYFANTVGSSNYLGLEPYFEAHGLAFRVLPVQDTTAAARGGSPDRVNLEKMYHNLMNFRLRGLADGGTYFGENIERMVGNFRSTFYRLSAAYSEAADVLEEANPLPAGAGVEQKRAPEVQEKIDLYRKRAGETFDYAQRSITDAAIPYGPTSLYFAAITLERMGKRDEAVQQLDLLMQRGLARVVYFRNHPATISDADEWLYFAERSVEFLLQTNQYAKAREYALMLFNATGQTRYQQLAAQLSAQLGVEQAQPAPAPPGK